MEQRRNVILTGFMGTGKTTVGRLVASRLGYEFIDTDALIEAEHGPIRKLFVEQGEPRFREIERKVVADLVNASGGGMMVDQENADTLAATGTVVCLTTDVDTIIDRALTPGGPVRPLLAGDDTKARVRELLVARASAYGRFAQIDTTRLTPSEVADAVIAIARG
jgi:shikimate kinase